jgi:hypothetical protein
MDFEKLPIKETLSEIDNEPNPHKAFENILNFGRENLPSKIWDTFKNMNLDRDIDDATKWIKSTLNKYPDTKGIYFGLDTLNMNDGNGSNAAIGLNADCDPSSISDDYTYDCETYGESHLIRGLFEVENGFNSELWPYDESAFTEYVIFLAYSGLVLRDALKKANIKNDFITVWGFHDGDSFFLLQKINNQIIPIAQKSL